MASQENHLDVVRYLLENGGNQSTATEVSNKKKPKLTQSLLYIIQAISTMSLDVYLLSNFLTYETDNYQKYPYFAHPVRSALK